jgi:hypothetical protein
VTTMREPPRESHPQARLPASREQALDAGGSSRASSRWRKAIFGCTDPECEANTDSRAQSCSRIRRAVSRPFNPPQLDVENQQTRAKIGRYHQCVLPAVSQLDLASERVQEIAERFGSVMVVIHHQHFRR